MRLGTPSCPPAARAAPTFGLPGWAERIRTSRRRFAEQPSTAGERTHNVSRLHANSAGISVRWTKRHLEVRILSAQPRVSEPSPTRGFEVDHQLILGWGLEGQRTVGSVDLDATFVENFRPAIELTAKIAIEFRWSGADRGYAEVAQLRRDLRISRNLGNRALDLVHNCRRRTRRCH